MPPIGTDNREQMPPTSDVTMRFKDIDAEPLISVVVATFNAVATLDRCINSVSEQTYRYKELIVIDGGSTDGTVEILKRNSEKIRYWISEPDRGIYHAWNKALVKAEGEWICFLGADDHFWDEHVLTRMVRELAKLPPDIRIAYGQIMLLNGSGERLYAVGEPWERLKQRFLKSMCIPHPGMMHRRSLFKQHGGFDESYRIAGDYELLLRELKTADAVFVPDLVTVGMRQGEGESSHPASTLRVLHETRRAQRLHGQRFPSSSWFFSMMKVYLRLLLWCVFGEPVARKTLDFGRRIMGQPAYWTRT
nr:glycosyltransferase family 2 protein [Nitrosomonas nitrosa]